MNAKTWPPPPDIPKATTEDEQQVENNILFEHMISGFEGALLTLYCFNIVERISGTLATASSTHPPPMLRMTRIIWQLRQQYRDQKEFYVAMDRLSHFSKIVDLLDMVAPLFGTPH